MKNDKQNNQNKDAGEKLKEALAAPVQLDDAEQKVLNTPEKDPEGANDKNREFLEDVLGKIEKGEIDLVIPAKLLNKSVYDGLSVKLQGETDLSAVSMLARLRDIKNLHDMDALDSFQMENLVEQVRLTKERLEKDTGDVFKI